MSLIFGQQNSEFKEVINYYDYQRSMLNTEFKKRFDKYHVRHEDERVLFGKLTLAFWDFDDQEYVLFSDQNNQGVASGKPWKLGPVPDEFAITGLGPIFFRVNNLQNITQVLELGLTFKQVKTEQDYTLFETGEGGNGASVIVEYAPNDPIAYQGYGGIHHVAFRIEDKAELDQWIHRLNEIGVSHSGFVDRFYFKSLYTRMYPGILFEFATDGPGFIDDEEPYETLGEVLALPPKFRNQREKIEQLVRHIDTVRSTKVFEKEYL